MRTIFDSMLINRIQLESFSNEVLLNCLIFEGGENYETDVILSSSAMNQFLIELASRDIEIDFEKDADVIHLPDGEVIQSIDLSKRSINPVYLPLYCLPERAKLLRA